MSHFSRSQTLSRRRLASVTVCSRYNDPAELAAMEHALGALCSCDRRAIASIWANSKIGDSYFLTLRPTQGWATASGSEPPSTPP